MRAVEKRLRENVAFLEKELSEAKQDRDLFRQHFSERFRWWIKLLGDGKTPDLPSIIEADAKWLRNFKWWSW